MKIKYSTAGWVAITVIAIPLIFGAISLGALFWLFAWNTLLVYVFPSLPLLDFWKAFILTIVLSFLTSSTVRK